MSILCWLGFHRWVPYKPDIDMYRCMRCDKTEYQP